MERCRTRFLKYQKGMFARIDTMKDLGFGWGHDWEASPRPTTPECGSKTWTGTASTRKSSMGCLLVTDLIPDGDRAPGIPAV